jgi:hypothetical protein
VYYTTVFKRKYSTACKGGRNWGLNMYASRAAGAIATILMIDAN